MNTPDKCPKCGAGVWIGSTSTERTIYLCWSEEEQSSACVSMERDRLVAENAALLERVKRLEEAGDRLATQLHSVSETEWISVGGALDAWTKAKEAKP